MSPFHVILVVCIAVTALSIAILMLDDVLAELDRRRRVDEFLAELRRARQRHS